MGDNECAQPSAITNHYCIPSSAERQKEVIRDAPTLLLTSIHHSCSSSMDIPMGSTAQLPATTLHCIPSRAERQKVTVEATMSVPFHHCIPSRAERQKVITDTTVQQPANITIAQQVSPPSISAAERCSNPPAHLVIAQRILQLFHRDPTVPSEQWVDVNALVQRAKTALGRNVVYDKELLASLNLLKFQESDYLKNDQDLRHGIPLDVIINRGIEPNRMHGADADTIRDVFKNDSKIEGTIELLKNGQLAFMNKDFKVNAFK